MGCDDLTSRSRSQKKSMSFNHLNFESLSVSPSDDSRRGQIKP